MKIINLTEAEKAEILKKHTQAKKTLNTKKDEVKKGLQPPVKTK